MPQGSPYPQARREEEEEFDVENGRQEDGVLEEFETLAQSVAVCLFPLDILFSCLSFVAVPSLAIAVIAVGFLYLHACPLEPLIPVWLIIQGFLILFGFVTERFSRHFEATKPPSASSSPSSSSSFSSSCTSFGSSSLPIRVFSIILTLVSVAWVTAGNVWVFRAEVQQREHGEAGETCDAVPFTCAFILVIASDALFVLLPLVLLLSRLCSRVCCRARCDTTDANNPV